MAGVYELRHHAAPPLTRRPPVIGGAEPPGASDPGVVESANPTKRSTPPGLQTDYAADERYSLRRCFSSSQPGGDNNCNSEATPPSYRKWAHSLADLLRDSEGVTVFKQFLDVELGGVEASNSLDFWFACNGLKLVDIKDNKQIHQLIRLIYKKFIKSNHLGLSYESRHRIAERLKSADVNQTLFDAVQDDVEDNMRINMYPMFLKSDTYIAYLQAGGSDSPIKSSTNSTDSSVAPTQTSALPTLHEDQELKQEDLASIVISQPLTSSGQAEAAVASMLALTPQSLMVTSNCRQLTTPNHRHPDGVYPEQRFDPGNSSQKTTASKRKLNPYHVTYAAISTRDSELQSMSSDTQTTDDSSIDGRGADKYTLRGHSKHWRKHRAESVKHNANQNRRTGLNEPLIARTDCVPKDRNLAETSPSAFAAMLVDRLLRVKQDVEQISRVHQRMRHIAEHDTGHKSKPVSLIANALGAVAHASQQKNPRISSLDTYAPVTTVATTSSCLPTSATYHLDNTSDSAQSILEEHVSRIWDSSSAESPVTPLESGQRRVSPLDHRGQLPGDRGRYRSTPRPTTSVATTRRLKDGKEPANERIMAWISGNTRVPTHNKCQYSTDQSETRSSSVHKQKSSGRKAAQTDQDIHCKSFSYCQEESLHQVTQSMSKSMLSYDHEARLKMPPPNVSLQYSQVFNRQQSFPLDLSSGEESFKPTTTVHKNTPIKPRPRPQLNCQNIVTVVGYYFCGEPIPYRSTVSTPLGGAGVTLGHFKQLITKRGHYRYFFKKACDEFDSGVVHEEISNDLDLLPLWDGKVVAKVERIESTTR